jgi:hypothetical protein
LDAKGLPFEDPFRSENGRYGGAKEFDPYHAELDRILDYSIALESVLTFEKSFVSRLMRKRAAALLGLDGGEATKVKKLVNTFYGYRSTFAHGTHLDIPDPQAFHKQMDEFEVVVRRVLKKALEAIPPDDAGRQQSLRGLYSVSDSDRLQWLREQTGHIEDKPLREQALSALPQIDEVGTQGQAG